MEGNVPTTGCVQKGTQGYQCSIQVQGRTQTWRMGHYSTRFVQKQNDDIGTETPLEFDCLCMVHLHIFIFGGCFTGTE